MVTIRTNTGAYQKPASYTPPAASAKPAAQPAKPVAVTPTKPAAVAPVKTATYSPTSQKSAVDQQRSNAASTAVTPTKPAAVAPTKTSTTSIPTQQASPVQSVAPVSNMPTQRESQSVGTQQTISPSTQDIGTQTFQVGPVTFDNQEQFNNYLQTTDAATVAAQMVEYGVSDQDFATAVNNLSPDYNFTEADVATYKAGGYVPPRGSAATYTVGNAGFTADEFKGFINNTSTGDIRNYLYQYGGTLEELRNTVNEIYGSDYDIATAYESLGLSPEAVVIGDYQFANDDDFMYYLNNTDPATIGQHLQHESVNGTVEGLLTEFNRVYGTDFTTDEAYQWLGLEPPAEPPAEDEPIVPEVIPPLAEIDEWTPVNTPGGATYNPTGSAAGTIPTVGYDSSQSNYSAPTPYEIPYEDTTAGQLEGLLSSGSPYMQQAATSGLKTANSRGLLNSSLSAQASQEAAIAAALPIAQQDSQQAFDAGMAGYSGQISGALASQGGQISGALADQAGGISGYLASQQGGISAALTDQDYGNQANLINVEGAASSQLSSQEYGQTAALSSQDYLQTANLTEQDFLNSMSLAASNAEYEQALSALQASQQADLLNVEAGNTQQLAELQAQWDADLEELQAGWASELADQEFGYTRILTDQEAQIALDYLEAQGLIQIDLANISALAQTTAAASSASGQVAAANAAGAWDYAQAEIDNASDLAVAGLNNAYDLTIAEMGTDSTNQYYFTSMISDTNTNFANDYLSIQTNPNLDATAKDDLLNGAGGLYDQYRDNYTTIANSYGFDVTWSGNNPTVTNNNTV